MIMLKTYQRHADIDSVTRVLLAAVLVAALALSSATGARGAPRLRPIPSAHAAVIGGQAAAPGTFPWMAYILDLRGDEVGQCSGTVVAPNLVLTAGHCAEDMQTGVVNEASGYRVATGNVDWAAPEAEKQVSDVVRVIPCPCFDRHTLVGDVALLQLSTPTTAPAVVLAADASGGTAALLAGWGEEYYGQAAAVEQLQWAPTVVESPGSCEREASLLSPASDVCAIGRPSHTTGVCFGDSGGPLLVAEPSAAGGMVQIGITSHAAGECATASPAVFTRADAIAAWVEGWTQALASDPPASASLPAGLVAAPTLPGLVSGRSVRLGDGALSLVLACDREGGVCSGDVEATITVREERIARSDGGRQIVSTRVLTVRLAKVGFAIAPGASVAVSSALSPQGSALLARLRGRTLAVTLAGPGVARRVVVLGAGGG
jgi:secreted trypsin-like serine protease